VLAAQIGDDFGHFNDHSDHGPFGLNVVNASLKEDLQRGSVTIRIGPNGHDNWTFNFLLELFFDDRSALSVAADGITLTEERQQQTFGVQGHIRLRVLVRDSAEAISRVDHLYLKAIVFPVRTNT
jgi:hypothetical protein